MTYQVTALRPFDPDADCVFDVDGRPCISAFGRALMVWLCCQDREVVTVDEAALIFNATPDVIREAADDYRWISRVDDRLEPEAG